MNCQQGRTKQCFIMFHNEICHGGQLQILSNVTHLRISISCFMYVSCFKIYITQTLCMYPPYVCWACSVHYNACVKDTPHIHEPRTKLHEAVLHNVPYWNESCWTTAHPIKQKDVCWLGDALGQKRAARPEVGAQASSALANLSHCGVHRPVMFPFPYGTLWWEGHIMMYWILDMPFYYMCHFMTWAPVCTE